MNSDIRMTSEPISYYNLLETDRFKTFLEVVEENYALENAHGSESSIVEKGLLKHVETANQLNHVFSEASKQLQTKEHMLATKKSFDIEQLIDSASVKRQMLSHEELAMRLKNTYPQITLNTLEQKICKLQTKTSVVTTSKAFDKENPIRNMDEPTEAQGEVTRLYFEINQEAIKNGFEPLQAKQKTSRANKERLIKNIKRVKECARGQQLLNAQIAKRLENIPSQAPHESPRNILEVKDVSLFKTKRLFNKNELSKDVKEVKESAENGQAFSNATIARQLKIKHPKYLKITVEALRKRIERL